MASGKRTNFGECASVACDRDAFVRGYCRGHYQRLQNGMNVDSPLGTRRTKEEKALALVPKRKPVEKPVEKPVDKYAGIDKIRPLADQIVAIKKFRQVEAALCGDSMGVGKTVTGIGRDIQLRIDRPDLADGATLIVCEKIGIDVWEYHLRAMGIPAEQILLVNPADREEFNSELERLRLFQAWKPAKMTKKGTVDKRSTGSRVPQTSRPPYRYYVVHLDVLTRFKALEKGRKGVEFIHVIADEVHLFKNRNAKRTHGLKDIKCLYKTGLSGTPADDKPWDFWSILHWLYPQKYTSFWRFYDNYVQSIYANQRWEWDEHVNSGGNYDNFKSQKPGTGYRIAVGVKNIQELHRDIKPFYIRRTLLEIAPNMPKKIHVMPATIVPMAARQRREYESMRDKAIVLIGQSEMDGVTSGSGFQLLAPAVIAVLTRLQQMALATLSPEWPISNKDFYESEEAYLYGDDDEWDAPKIVLTKPSPKLDAVMNIIDTHEEESFVVFTQFRGMADLIEEECQTKGITVVKIHGGIGDRKTDPTRTELVKQFQDGKARVFVGTIAAAGKTITLTKAHHVIFTDLSWNPSKNEQAEDRLWRRTQTSTVMVHQIQSEDSIDQVRADRITQKGQWIKQLLNPKHGS